MRHLALVLLTFFICSPAVAKHQQVIDIKVNGMVCDFCAQSVWKVFKEYDAVEDIKIDLDTGMVTVLLKPGQTLEDEKLDEGITYAGYELVDITKREEDHP